MIIPVTMVTESNKMFEMHKMYGLILRDLYYWVHEMVISREFNFAGS